ncbi:dimethylargininase [Aestuariimicrobium ganziense]|uniref:dimethylargininase n=1 Tax=Aestuariimicrobium ganziense TaxID=2773677 RepID=UPI001941D852|nr:dimethylargininase [Aestuariimicrobium ganziense]
MTTDVATVTSPVSSALAARPARSTSVLMCPPTHFTVDYAINPWMDPERPVSTPRALEQWHTLRRAYLDLGITVETIEPLPGLPDMVYAANGAFVLDGIAYGARFKHSERAGEGPAYLAALEDLGFETRQPRFINEGEGDFRLVGDQVLAGHGFRTCPEAHCEVSRIFDREVTSLRLVDPRYYHLDTALAVVGESVAWLPAAFDESSQTVVRRRFPEAIEVSADEAAALGLNVFGDGHAVVMTDRAPQFAAALRSHGHQVVEVDLSELLLGGGSVKCCTLELRK